MSIKLLQKLSSQQSTTECEEGSVIPNMYKLYRVLLGFQGCELVIWIRNSLQHLRGIGFPENVPFVLLMLKSSDFMKIMLRVDFA